MPTTLASSQQKESTQQHLKSAKSCTWTLKISFQLKDSPDHKPKGQDPQVEPEEDSEAEEAQADEEVHSGAEEAHSEDVEAHSEEAEADHLEAEAEEDEQMIKIQFI